MSGIIYCLTNPAMPDYVKIGKTNNLHQRLKDLDNTSIPLPFECVYAIEVDDPDKLERLMHDTFSDKRIRRTREFFEIGIAQVIAAMNLTSGRDVTPSVDTVEDNESQVALDKAREKRESFNFDMVGIPQGTELEYYGDPNIKCTVLNSKQVLFNGLETSLSASATQVAIQKLEDKGEIIPEYLTKRPRGGSGVAGPQYWCFDGETMSQRRNRMQTE